MANPIVYNNSANGQTKSVVSALGGQSVEVTTSAQTPPTVTLNAALVLGSLAITADSGATAIVNVVTSAGGSLSLNASGGTIEASSTISALSGVAVNIANNGVFQADSSFLALLNQGSVTFAGDTGSTDTLRLNNGGGLLNFTETSAFSGYQGGGTDIIEDNLIAAADVASYAITQAAQGQPDVLTYYDVNGQSLGSLTFASGTFNSGQLGTFAASAVGGPLQLTTAQGGGLSTSTNGNVYYGGGRSATPASGTWTTLNSTGGNWDLVTGSQGYVYVTSAQASIVGGNETIYFDNSSIDAVSLYSTNGNYDTVYGSAGCVVLTSAQATIVGGSFFIYGYSGSSVSLSGTNNNWDGFYGSGETLTLTSAQAAITGGSNLIYGYSHSSVSLFNTNNNADTFTGSDDQIILVASQASVQGGGDVIYATSGSSVSLSNTAGSWDAFYGSGSSVTVTSSQASIVGGGDTVSMSTGSAISLYSTSGSADLVTGSNVAVNLTSAQASLTGTADTIYMSGQSTASLNGNIFALNFAANIGQETVNGFNSTDGLVFSKNDWASFSALQQSGDLFDSNGNAVIRLDANDSVTLTGVQVASLSASQFSFV
jgi:hypothetical protein